MIFHQVIVLTHEDSSFHNVIGRHKRIQYYLHTNTYISKALGHCTFKLSGVHSGGKSRKSYLDKNTYRDASAAADTTSLLCSFF